MQTCVIQTRIFSKDKIGAVVEQINPINDVSFKTNLLFIQNGVQNKTNHKFKLRETLTTNFTNMLM